MSLAGIVITYLITEQIKKPKKLIKKVGKFIKRGLSAFAKRTPKVPKQRKY